MEFEQLLESLDSTMYESLKRAVELGKWPDGRLLQGEDRQVALRVLIAYDARHKPLEDRIGYIDNGSKQDGDSCTDDSFADDVDLIHRE